jgi:hypothetical protein
LTYKTEQLVQQAHPKKDETFRAISHTFDFIDLDLKENNILKAKIVSDIKDELLKSID